MDEMTSIRCGNELNTETCIGISLTYTKPVGLETMSLLILLVFRFLGEAGGLKGGEDAGGDTGWAGDGISSYRGPAMGSGVGEVPRQKRRDGDGVLGMRASKS